MLDLENIFEFRLTLTDSFPEIWRRVLVPSECALGDLHYVISYSFCWFQDSAHEFSQGSRSFGPRDKDAPAEREDEHKAFLSSLFRRPGHDMHYVYSFRDEWCIHVTFEGEQAPVPNGHYPCCIDGNNGGPPDGVGGISRYNEVFQAFDNPEDWKALRAELGRAEWLEGGFEPTYLNIGDINGALSLIFPVEDDANPFGSTASGARA